MISTRVEALSTTAELLVSASGVDAAVPRTVYLTGGTAASIYIGGPNVTEANGYPLHQGSLAMLLAPGDDLWAIAGTGTPSVNVMVTRADA
jgi:hypothetical protein